MAGISRAGESCESIPNPMVSPPAPRDRGADSDKFPTSFASPTTPNDSKLKGLQLRQTRYCSQYITTQRLEHRTAPWLVSPLACLSTPPRAGADCRIMSSPIPGCIPSPQRRKKSCASSALERREPKIHKQLSVPLLLPLPRPVPCDTPADGPLPHLWFIRGEGAWTQPETTG